MTPGDKVAQLYPQAPGTHFSRLLRHAWVTVGLFFNPGHHTGPHNQYLKSVLDYHQAVVKTFLFSVIHFYIFYISNGFILLNMNLSFGILVAGMTYQQS
jgi:hypothetical protein